MEEEGKSWKESFFQKSTIWSLFPLSSETKEGKENSACFLLSHGDSLSSI